MVETVAMNLIDEVKAHAFDDEATPWLFNYEIMSDKIKNDTLHESSEC